MRRRSSLPVRPGAALPVFLLALTVWARPTSGQQPTAGFQQPIFGCRHAISCRNAPIGFSGLNDLGTIGLMAAGSIKWGPGFHFGLAIPILKLPATEPESAVDVHGFHLRNVTLLPTPEPTPAPTPVPE